MMINTLKRVAWGLGLALLLSLVTVAIGQTQDAEPTATPERQCADCHGDIQTHWEESEHGRAAVDAAFVEAWEAEDKSPACLACHTTGFNAATSTYEAPGVTCDSCHTLVENGPNHPEQIMTTDYSAAACGTCHVDTYDQWQVSQHGEAEMNCINCHNPHSTSIKTDTVQELCKTCHTTEGHFYTYTAHAEEGLLCTDCHLQVMEGAAVGEGHNKRVHTFDVDLSTCNECHEHEMHSSGQMSAIGGTAGSDSGEPPTGPLNISAAAVQTHPQPQPTSYLNFALLAGLIGLAFGAIGSPWFERGLRLLLVGAKRGEA